MSFLVVKELFCDRCAEWLRLEGSMKQLWPGLAKDGWTRGGGEHYCPSCSQEIKEESGLASD